MLAPVPSGPVDLWVTISTGTQPARRLLISTASALIGRLATCAVHVEHPSVSREHARIDRTDNNQWRITDLGSHNGTLISGHRINSNALGDGDKITIGPFTLVFEMVRASVGLSNDMSIVRSLAQMAAPRLALEQLNRLDDFGQLVLDTADASARRMALCRLLLQPEFGARWAVVVSAAPGSSPIPLCTPQSASGEEPILSRTLIAAVITRNEPVMATNSPGGGSTGSPRNIEMSISPEVTTLTAVAVPLAVGPDGSATLLCVGFPPRYATSEWLALCGLAGRQYHQAETVWTNLAARQKTIPARGRP